jgi:hypothetical protein
MILAALSVCASNDIAGSAGRGMSAASLACALYPEIAQTLGPGPVAQLGLRPGAQLALAAMRSARRSIAMT